MSDFPNILVIKIPSNSRFLQENGHEAGFEKGNLIPLGERQKNAGKYGVYFPNKPFNNPLGGCENWLVFMVEKLAKGKKSLIAWYEGAELLEDWEHRSDVQLLEPYDETGSLDIAYQILAEEAYFFENEEVQPCVENLKNMQSAPRMYLRVNGEDRYPDAVEELLNLRDRALEEGRAVYYPTSERDFFRLIKLMIS